MRYNSIKKDKFYTAITYDGRKFFGECFDRRLDLSDIHIHYAKNDTIPKILKKITKEKGKYKYFIGIDEQIINLLNTLGTNDTDMTTVNKYPISRNDDFTNGDFTFVAENGVIFMRRSSGNTKQIDELFSEFEVERRLGYLVDFLNNHPHECGGVCTSRDKEGKSCEILTFRENCHFHR